MSRGLLVSEQTVYKNIRATQTTEQHLRFKELVTTTKMNETCHIR